MKASEISIQLAVILPQLTDQISNDVSVASLTRSGTLMTAVCNQSHGLDPGDLVTITGAEHQLTITSLTRTDPTSGTAVGTLVTSLDHDLTFRSPRDTVSQLPTTIEIRGAADAEYNGTFPIESIPNRKTITFTIADTGPLSTTGGVLIDAESDLRDYNASYSVLGTPDATTFTFAHSASTMLDALGTIVARTKPRVGHAITIERAVEAYTKQLGGNLWLFTVLGDVFASKSRTVRSDATDNLQFGNEFRQQIVQPFTVYAFVPVRDSLSGSGGRDEAEDLFRPLCRSLLMKQFDSGLAVGSSQGPSQFVDHGAFRYDTSTYIHAFSFQQVVDLIFEDTVGPADDVAFRNIDLTIFPDFDLDADTGISFLRNSAIDLDDVPL